MRKRRNKTIIKADRIEHVDVAKTHNPRRGTRWFGGKAGLTASARAFGSPRAMELRDLLEREVYTPQEFEEFSRLFERINKQSKRQKGKMRGVIPRAFGARRNAEGKADILQQGVKAGLLPAGLVTDLQRLEEGRFPADPARRANLLERALKVRNDLVYQNLVEENLLGEAVQRALFDVIARQQRQLRSRRNPAEKDPEHPIEVTRHFRGGPPGYLSPWQKAMSIGQQELFDTGIKLAPRAAELRAARLSNPGATKPVYQSGLKQATAGQLPRLARVGLRVGRTPAEIRSDLATTGRFTAEQIRRAIDQATTAERRSNPPSSYQALLKEYPAKVKLLREVVTAYNFFVPAGAPKPTRAHMRAAEKAAADYFKYELPKLLSRKSLTTPDVLDSEIRKYEELYRNMRGGYAWDWYPLEWREFWKEKNPPVREIFETFNGRPATRATSVEAPRRTPARVAQLGRLRLIRTADGRTWRFPGERAPFLAADSRGKLHVVGGQYRANPAGEECGEIEQIEYQTSKPHLGHDHETIYYHQLGEETGERPVLEITPEGELQIIGGNYRIEADGIHN